MNHFLYITWDLGSPSPGIDLGFFVIRYYSLMWALAFYVGLETMKRIVFKTEKVDPSYLEPFLFHTIIGCMIGARLGHVIFYQTELLWEHPLAVLLPISPDPDGSVFGILKGYTFSGFAGLASHGATLGMIISTYIFHRKYPKLNLYWLIDRLILTIPIGGALIRIGNFFNSEIIGKVANYPWCVNFIQAAEFDGRPRHPTQLYEALGYIILFFILVWIYYKTDKRRYRGWMFGFFFMVLWLIRFFVEFYKEPQGEEALAKWFNLGLNNGQLLSIPFIILGIVMMITAKKYTHPPVKE